MNEQRSNTEQLRPCGPERKDVLLSLGGWVESRKVLINWRVQPKRANVSVEEESGVLTTVQGC